MLDAFFALIGEGAITPTAQQIAERAGVGIRTIFRHFSEMEMLFSELDVRIREEAAAYLDCEPEPGSTHERARHVVRARIRCFERVAPYLRSTRANRWRSTFLEASYSRFVLDQRANLHRWLPELADAPQAHVDAIELATSFESWDRLRTEQGLSGARAQAALEQIVLSTLRTVES